MLREKRLWLRLPLFPADSKNYRLSSKNTRATFTRIAASAGLSWNASLRIAFTKFLEL